MGRHSGVPSRASKKSVQLCRSDCGGDENEYIAQQFQQRSVSLAALHTSVNSPQYLFEPRMSQLENLEAKMASIEVSLSATPRRKKSGSVSGGINSPTNHRNRECYKELDTLRVALRDKENIIQTLKGQLCNTLNSRLALRNGVPPLTEADRQVTEERLNKFRRDADNKRLTIKNLKLALERLDISDNIDVRIQQAELEYRLGKEELELLTLKEESRALQAALELAETQEKQKNDTIFSCITGPTQITIHAIEISADPKSPRFGAGPKEDAAGLYVDWATEDSGLCKGDRILEVNGKLVVGAGRNDFTRLLAVAPDAAQIVVLRKSESLAALRTLRSDNLRLTHRISYLEEQVRDLLAPRPEIPVTTATIVKAPPRKDRVQVFQKGPQVTTLVSKMPGLGLKDSTNTRQSLSNVKLSSCHSQQHGHFNYSSMEALSHSRSSRSKHKMQQQQCHIHLARSTASLDHMQEHHHYQFNGSSVLSATSPRHRATKDIDEQKHHHKSHKYQHQLLQSIDFDSEPTYYSSLQGIRWILKQVEILFYHSKDTQFRAPEYSKVSVTGFNTNEYSNEIIRPAPPKKPVRLSLHRAASLQSVESAPPMISTSLTNSYHQEYAPSKKPKKRNHRGDPPIYSDLPLSRVPSRAESCQSAFRWPSPKPKPNLAQVSVEKWC